MGEKNKKIPLQQLSNLERLLDAKPNFKQSIVMSDNNPYWEDLLRFFGMIPYIIGLSQPYHFGAQIDSTGDYRFKFSFQNTSDDGYLFQQALHQLSEYDLTSVTPEKGCYTSNISRIQTLVEFLLCELDDFEKIKGLDAEIQKFITNGLTGITELEASRLESSPMSEYDQLVVLGFENYVRSFGADPAEFAISSHQDSGGAFINLTMQSTLLLRRIKDDIARTHVDYVEFQRSESGNNLTVWIPPRFSPIAFVIRLQGSRGIEAMDRFGLCTTHSFTLAVNPEKLYRQYRIDHAIPYTLH